MTTTNNEATPRIYSADEARALLRCVGTVNGPWRIDADGEHINDDGGGSVCRVFDYGRGTLGVAAALTAASPDLAASVVHHAERADAAEALDIAARAALSHVVGEDAARGLSWAALSQRARETAQERESIARERYDALAASAKLTQERDAATARVAALEGALRDHAEECFVCEMQGRCRVGVWLYTGLDTDHIGATCDEHRGSLSGRESRAYHDDVLRSLTTTEGR